MMQFSPGALILYRRSTSFFPLWPAVICEEDMGAEEVREIRPHGNSILVLLMGEQLILRWAHTEDIGEYDPFAPHTHAEVIGSTTGLGDAYIMANNALESGLDLAYWKAQLMNLVSDASDSDNDANDSDEDSHSDLELREALRLSREHYYSKRSKGWTAKGSSNLPNAPLSSARPARFQSNRCVPVIAGADSAPNTISNAWEAPSRSVASSSQPSRVHRDASTPQGRLHMSRKDTPIELADDCSTSIESRQFQPSGFLDNQLRSLGRGRKEPINDTIEGELSESKEFVEVLVGPDQEIYTFPLQSLWNRHYFRDPKQGLLLIDYNKRGMWELKHPSLFDIKPDDFVFVAEYLESDDFGHRNPQDGEEMTEAFAQCVAAWVTAEKLGMSDMMDHTVEKLERLEPEMLEILVFCRHVYARETTSISHEYLKGHLAVYIADNFWEYIKDDHLRSSFIELLQHFPELQQDVYERRILALKECVDQSQEDSDTDMD